MCLKEAVLVNVVIPSKPLFSFFCRGNMKAKNESFCYNKWMKCVAITFCSHHMLPPPLTFMRTLCINSRFSFINVVVRDQNILLFPTFVLQRTVRRSVCMCI